MAERGGDKVGAGSSVVAVMSKGRCGTAGLTNAVWSVMRCSGMTERGGDEIGAGRSVVAVVSEGHRRAMGSVMAFIDMTERGGNEGEGGSVGLVVGAANMEEA